MQPDFDPHTPKLAFAALAAVATLALALFVDQLASGPGPFQMAAKPQGGAPSTAVAQRTAPPPVRTAAAATTPAAQ